MLDYWKGREERGGQKVALTPSAVNIEAIEEATGRTRSEEEEEEEKQVGERGQESVFRHILA